MPSHILYPPIVDSYMPAFRADQPNSKCEIVFSLSKFNGFQDIQGGCAHISIIKQGTGENVVYSNSDSSSKIKDTNYKRLRKAGIILNAAIEKKTDADNLYSVTIYDDDIKSLINKKNQDGTQTASRGFVPGCIYKVQLRLSQKFCNDVNHQDDWLNKNFAYFSEWSTVCIIKAIGRMDYVIPFLEINTANNQFNSNVIHTHYFSTLELTGHFNEINDPSEYIDYYRFQLFDSETDKLIEDSKNIYLNQNEVNNNSFHYTFKTEFEDGKIYKIAFKFVTKSKYEGGFYKWGKDKKDERFIIECSYTLLNNPPCRLLTIENDIANLLTNETNLDLEENEGRIALKFYRPDDQHYSGNLCIRRSDSRSDFKEWTDIYIKTIKNDFINNAPIVYDYTIESGVYYQYGVQEIDKDGFRSKLRPMSYKVMRNFNYCFLLGENNQQLKLMFDNTMTNFKYQIFDSKIDTIGSKYATITRNAATYYRTFPINGLISFLMDENKLFCDKNMIYKYEDVVDLYDEYKTRNHITQYDYIYERDFRNKVLEFLQDGKFKLFKSPTEGNIIVRLMDINCVPNQSLDRMLYSFSATGYEMADNTLENYLKYGFYSLAEPATSFSTYETRLGQLMIDYPISKNAPNIFSLIYDKYDTTKRVSINGLSTKVKKIHHVKLTFEGPFLRVENNSVNEDEKEIQNKNNALVLGNNFVLGDNKITVYNPNRIYEFDDLLSFDPTTDKLILLGDQEGEVTSVPVTVDFLYDVELEIYQGKRVQSRTIEKGMGQIFKECLPNENLFYEIYCKYFFEIGNKFSKMTALNFVELEANPGTVFGLKDVEDEFSEKHIVGSTGILRLYDIQDIIGLIYLGVQDAATGEVKQEKADVMVNYSFTLVRGTYVAN